MTMKNGTIKPVVLLLEDDMQLSETLRSFLTRQGYEVYCAYDGRQAQDIAYEKRIDVMLLDVKVPHIDGFRFLRETRMSGNDVPALFITSLNSVEDVEKGFKAGGDDYLRKPFALKELLVRIEALLKRRYATHDMRVRIDESKAFDTKEQILYHNGERVALKTKERKLLSLFLRYPDELLTYETIFAAVWEYDETPSNGSLRTYIKTLRALLGKERIETVKNTGYRFVSQ
jgi:DNA-binding response OmpR family regulator